MTKAVIITFIKTKRNIVNIASISGVSGWLNKPTILPPKAGLLYKSLAKKIAALNIRVNAVAPGFIETDMVAGLNADYMKQVLNIIPMKDLERQRKWQRGSQFLLNEKAGYITDQLFRLMAV